VIKLVQAGKIDLKPFITGKIALENLIDEGFDTLIHRNDTAVKILVSPRGADSDRPRHQIPGADPGGRRSNRCENNVRGFPPAGLLSSESRRRRSRRAGRASPGILRAL